MENWQLKQMQSLPLEAKIIKSKQRIREFYEYFSGNVYISVSGKDSMVVYDLVRSLYPNVPAVFCNTGLEYPEVVKNAKQLTNTEHIRPHMPFHKVIKHYGYPVINKEQSSYIQEYRTTSSEKLRHYRWYGNKNKKFKISEKWKFLVYSPFKISDKCCDIIKKKPFYYYEKDTKRYPFLGIMADDTNQRKQQYLRHGGCNAFNLTRPRSLPIGFWTNQDVLAYLKTYDVPYPEVYGTIYYDGDQYTTTGEDNTGCMFCMFGVHREPQPNKFQRMKYTHPKHYKYCMEKLGLKEVLEFLNVPYE